MSRIFISHSSANNAHALAVAQWLEENGWGEYFLDITPVQGLTPGERWQAALRKAADRCQVVVFLISPAWADSKWCLAEFLLAKQLGKAVYGVLIEPTPLDELPKEMTAEWQLCDLTAGSERKTFSVYHDGIVPQTTISYATAGLIRLKLGLQKAGLDPSTFPWPPASEPERAPYRGLKALEAEDAAIFFGRDADLVRSLDALRKIRDVGTDGMLVILGASGSGKSSFLRAGLWPRLKRDDRHFYLLPVIRPERAAITGKTGLVTSLETAFRERSVVRNRADIHQCLKEPDGLDRLVAELQQHTGAGLETDAPRQTLIIPIDQGEELFASEGRDEAEQFLTHLGQLLAPPSVDEESIQPCHRHAVALIAIRSDSYARLQGAGRVAHVKQILFDLKPIDRVEYKAIIEGPAQRSTAAGRTLTVDPLLTTQLVDEAEGADALPLLGFILERLCVEYGADGGLKLSEYQSLGGVAGSIESAIKSAFANPHQEPAIPPDDSLRLLQLREAFIPWLAWIDPDTEERKRRIARWDDMPTESHPFMERLIGARLLLKDERAVPGRETTETVIEIAHEALLRQWNPLVAWLSEEATNLKAVEAVKRAAAEWKKEKNEAWLLHAGERLAAAEALLRRQNFSKLLGEDAGHYLRACRAREEAVRVERETMLQRQLELQKARTEAAEEARQAAEEARLAQQARAQYSERARDAEAKRAEAADRARRRQWCFSLALLILFLGAWITTWLWQKGYSVEQAVLQIQSFVVSIHKEPEMQPVPAGTLDQVSIKPFAIGKFEVTFEEYDRFAIDMNQPFPGDQTWGRGRHPVINVSWDDAKAYTEWLSKRTGKSYRLPRELEWEYAARSGGQDQMWAGTSNKTQLKDYAVYLENSQTRTAPVGEKKPNGLGLYDMSGNVLEWAQDCAGKGTKEDECRVRAIRGGSWANGPENLRASHPRGLDAGYRGTDQGFRLAQDID